MIRKVKILSKEFHGPRTAYSSSAFFMAILSNSKDSYDHEAIVEKILPDGFGCIEPPGPSFGFGKIVLEKAEKNGKVSKSKRMAHTLRIPESLETPRKFEVSV